MEFSKISIIKLKISVPALAIVLCVVGCTVACCAHTSHQHVKVLKKIVNLTLQNGSKDVVCVCCDTLHRAILCMGSAVRNKKKLKKDKKRREKQRKGHNVT